MATHCCIKFDFFCCFFGPVDVREIVSNIFSEEPTLIN